MPQPTRDSQALYTALLVAAVVAVVAVIRREQAGPAPDAERAAPVQRAESSARVPRPLVITDPVPWIPLASKSRREVAVGFPANEDRDIGPITSEEASIYSPGGELAESPAETIPGMHRLPVETDDQPQATTVDSNERPIVAQPSIPVVPHPVHEAALRPVLQQAAQLNRQAESLGRRGAYYLARNVTIQSLRRLAEALDEQTGSGQHTAALASALTALREAADFQPRSSEDSTVSVAMVVAGHRTLILKQDSAQSLSPLAAQQQYLDFAQKEFAIAAGGQPVASQALCNLGKLEARMNDGAGATKMNLARAVACHEAALAVDERNYPAANELGAVLMSLGQLPEARRALEHSVATRPNAAAWQNLAAVHGRLGETESAHHALEQRDLLGGGEGGPRPKIEWVSPEVFAGNQPASVPKAVAKPTDKKAKITSAKDRTADNRPKQMETWISPFSIKW